MTHTELFFTGENIKFDRSSDGLLESWSLTREDIIGLCAVPNGATVKLKSKTKWTKAEIPDGEQVPVGLHVSVTQPDLFAEPSEFMVFDEASGHRSLYYKLVIARARPLSNPVILLKGMGGEMVRRSVAIARQLRFGRIRMLAAGGRTWPDRDDSGNRWLGYLAWPRYGFNMLLLESDRELFGHFQHYPRELSTCKSVLALLSLDGGPDYWKACGSGSYMEFDLQDGSDSVRKLQAWLDSTGRSRGEHMANAKKRVKPQVDGSQQAQFSGVLPKTAKRLALQASLNDAQSAASVEQVKRLRRRGGVELPLEILD